MIKCSYSSVLITILLITLNTNNVICRRMPIRMLLQRFQEHQAEVSAHGIGRQATGSESEAHSSALTNAVNIAGIPITNTVSGSHAASTSSGNSGNFQEHFGLGGFGLDVGLASDKIGSGITANRVPGEQLGLHIGGLTLGLSNKGGLFGSQNTQTQTGATAAATGQGAQSSSQSNTHSNSISGLGGLINVQNTLSNSQAQAHSQDGIASANSDANSLAAAQTVNVPNFASAPAQSNFHQPGIGGIFNSFPTNPFGNFNGAFGAIQPFQHNPQQQFGYQQFAGQQFPNQQQYFPSQQYPIQQYPAQQYPGQRYPIQQYPHQQGYNIYGQQLLPSQGNFGTQNPSYNAPGLNDFNNQQRPVVQPTNTQNQGLDSAFLDMLKEKENAATTPIPNSQTGSNGPALVQGGLQNTYTPQQNIPQANVAENTIPTAQNSVDDSAPGQEFNLDVRIEEDEAKSKNATKSKKVKRSANPRHRHHHQGSPPPQQEGFGIQPFSQPFPQYQQQNANSNGFAQNQNPFFNQNAGSNTYSQNNQNPFGQFQNTGGSSIGSNLANDGLSGQVSAANTDQQSFLTAQGFGQKNNGQSQSTNFDQFGNLQLSNANTGTQFTEGSDGQRNQANGASNAHLQNEYGTSDSGSQTMSEDFVGPNGEKGSKSSSSAFSSNVNNGNGNIGDMSDAGLPQRSKRATSEDAVSFPKEDDTKLVTASENKPSTAENEKEAGNGTELDSRFGGPFAGVVRQVIGGLLGRQNQGPFDQGSFNQGPFNQGGYYPQQGNFYNQAPGIYPPQGNYYDQGPGYYPQQPYPLQPNFGGRFRRAAQGALIFPDDEEEKNVITPDPVETTKTANTATSVGTTEEKTKADQNNTDLESRFGFHGRGPFGGAIREAIGEFFGVPNERQYGRPPPPHYGGNPYVSEHYHSRPDYPTHHHHHHHQHHRPEGPQYPNHNQPPAYPLQPANVPSNQPYEPSYQQPQYNQQPGMNYQQPINQQTNANGAAQAQNQNAISNQNSASNTHSSNVNNGQGNFQNTGGSSISSNIANNGQSGQVSSSNTEQQSYQTAQGSGAKNTGQSQSANFDQHGNLGTSSANTGTQHTVGPDGERNQATGAANSHQQSQHGVADSTSQTNAETFNQNGVMGNKASGQSTSAFQGQDGSVLAANSGSETQTFEGPNGIKGTSSSSHSSSQNIGNGLGGNVGTSSSSGSGNGFGGSQTYSNAGGFNTSPYGGSGAQTNAFSGSNNFGSNAGANAGSNTLEYNRPVQAPAFIFS